MLPVTESVTFIVSFRWIDNRSGKVIVKRTGYAVTGTYYDLTSVTENYRVGAEEVINKLAKRITEHMESDW